jgi:hypothetical protein
VYLRAAPLFFCVFSLVSLVYLSYILCPLLKKGKKKLFSLQFHLMWWSAEEEQIQQIFEEAASILPSPAEDDIAAPPGWQIPEDVVWPPPGGPPLQNGFHLEDDGVMAAQLDQLHLDQADDNPPG